MKFLKVILYIFMYEVVHFKGKDARNEWPTIKQPKITTRIFKLWV